MVIAKSLFYFVLAGLCEIGGGYLVWLWLRENKSLWFAVVGAIVLIFYGIVPTFQPAHFGRVYAAYGGIFIVMAMLVGLADRQDTTRQVRHSRSTDCTDRCLHYYVLAADLILMFEKIWSKNYVTSLILLYME